ncbi:MAG: cupin domain-containing protein [Azospirillaceae bacterium]
MTDDARPTGREPENRPIAAAEIPWEEFRHGSRYALRYRHLSAATPGQPYRVGVAVEELPPGKQSCPAHYHTAEEEHVYVLTGALTVRLGRRRIVMSEGDYVRFPAGSAEEHCLINHTDRACTYLVIGERNVDDVRVYPESNKVMIARTREIFDRGTTRDYWDGETVD